MQHTSRVRHFELEIGEYNRNNFTTFVKYNVITESEITCVFQYCTTVFLFSICLNRTNWIHTSQFHLKAQSTFMISIDPRYSFWTIIFRFIKQRTGLKIRLMGGGIVLSIKVFSFDLFRYPFRWSSFFTITQPFLLWCWIKLDALDHHIVHAYFVLRQHVVKPGINRTYNCAFL